MTSALEGGRLPAIRTGRLYLMSFLVLLLLPPIIIIIIIIIITGSNNGWLPQ
jgi:hypothetical protein